MERWTIEQEKILVEKYMDTDYKALSTILNKTEGAIRAKCFDLNLVKKNKWTDDEILFLKENYSKMSKSDIAKYLNRTETSIKVKANKLGIKKYPYICNYEYFKDIDTESKAYWLGFIYADGWITKNSNTNSGCLGIQLKESDVDHLRKFNKDIDGNYPINFGEKICTIDSNNKSNPYCLIRIYSINMVNDLFNHGVNFNKSYNLVFPYLQEDLMRQFLRGFFDGDGCIRSRTRKLASGEIKKYPVCDITCHEKSFLESIRGYIYSKGLNSYIYPDGSGFRLYLSGQNDNIKFLNYIYEDATIYLDRKYKRYQEIKNYTNDDCLAS